MIKVIYQSFEHGEDLATFLEDLFTKWIIADWKVVVREPEGSLRGFQTWFVVREMPKA